MIIVVVSATTIWEEVLGNLMRALFAEKPAIGKCFYSVMLENYGERMKSDLVLGSMNAQTLIDSKGK